MNIEIKNDDNNYITIALSGEYSKEDVDKIPNILLKASLDMQKNKILLDTNKLTDRVVNTYLQYEFGENLAKQLNGESIILGIYGNNEIYSDFTETVAVNRGLVVKVSPKHEELVAWLDI